MCVDRCVLVLGDCCHTWHWTLSHRWQWFLSTGTWRFESTNRWSTCDLTGLSGLCSCWYTRPGQVDCVFFRHKYLCFFRYYCVASLWLRICLRVGLKTMSAPMNQNDETNDNVNINSDGNLLSERWTLKGGYKPLMAPTTFRDGHAWIHTPSSPLIIWMGCGVRYTYDLVSATEERMEDLSL